MILILYIHVLNTCRVVILIEMDQFLSYIKLIANTNNVCCTIFNNIIIFRLFITVVAYLFQFFNFFKGRGPSLGILLYTQFLYCFYCFTVNYENIYFNISTLQLTLDKEVKLESLCTTDLFWSYIYIQRECIYKSTSKYCLILKDPPI